MTKKGQTTEKKEKTGTVGSWYGTVGYCTPLQDAGRTIIIYSRPSSFLFYLFHPTSNQKHDKKQSLNTTKIEDPTSFFFELHIVSYLCIQSNITKATDN